MFPKLETNSLLNKEKIAANIIQEDHVKDMLSKTRNTSYKPWKSSFCPKNSHSPFGDFPKAFLNPKPSGRAPKPIFEKAQATSYYAGRLHVTAQDSATTWAITSSLAVSEEDPSSPASTLLQLRTAEPRLRERSLRLISESRRG